MKVQFNKELVSVIGQGAMKYGKLVVVEGLKSIAAQGATRVINTAFNEGIDSVKAMKFDDVVGVNQTPKQEKGLFGKKKKGTEKTEDSNVEETETVEVEIVED